MVTPSTRDSFNGEPPSLEEVDREEVEAAEAVDGEAAEAIEGEAEAAIKLERVVKEGVGEGVELFDGTGEERALAPRGVGEGDFDISLGVGEGVFDVGVAVRDLGVGEGDLVFGLDPRCCCCCCCCW